MVINSKAYRYATWCIQKGNEKVPIYVKKQAQDWIDIVHDNHPEAYIDNDAFEKINNLLKLMVHPDLRCPMDEGLEEYAWLLIVAALCTKLRNSKVMDIRYYTTIVLEISRKNFKTFNAAIIFILLLLTDPQFSRFFSVAPDLKLSSELKVGLRKIIKSSPLLAEEKVFKVMRSEIRCILTDSEYIPLAYSEDKMDGKLANAFLADEAGAMDSYPIEAMRSSQITLYNKLGIIISTQYPNDNNGMIDEIDISKKVLDGVIDNRRRFSLLYEPNEQYLVDDMWQREDKVIYQSNPVAVAHKHIFEAIKDMREMAVLYENKRENYLCKHNNIKYKGLGVEGYVDIIKVKQCKVKENLEFWKGRDVYIGLDLSLSDDNVCVAMVCEDEHGHIHAKTWGFIPKDRKAFKSKKENVDYDKLIKQKVCFACGDEIVDYVTIEEFVLNIEPMYGVKIVQLGFDKWNAISSVQKFEREGIECVEIKQHSSVLHMPTKLLREYILKKKFEYDENQMLEINFQNAKCTEDTNKNKYVNKKKSSGKIDQVVGVINATYLLQQNMLYGNEDFGAQVG